MVKRKKPAIWYDKNHFYENGKLFEAAKYFKKGKKGSTPKLVYTPATSKNKFKKILNETYETVYYELETPTMKAAKKMVKVKEMRKGKYKAFISLDKITKKQAENLKKRKSIDWKNFDYDYDNVGKAKEMERVRQQLLKQRRARK